MCMGTLLPFERFPREVIVKAEGKADPAVGCALEQRPMEQLLDFGIVNVDKPKGPTSHQVSDYLQKILHIGKAGHSGTLDPAVTGVLPIALGKGTRVVQARSEEHTSELQSQF